MGIGPKHLLKSGLKQALEYAGFKPKILKEIFVRKTKDNLRGIADTAVRANKIVKQEVQAGNKILALGGDHAISIGTISGAAEAVSGELGVIWIDAHPDLHTHETSLSGYVHGMVSAALLGFGDERLTDLIKTRVKKETFLYIGLKDLDQAEVDFIWKQKLSVFSMFDIFEKGFFEITKSIQALQKRVNNIWISFGVDSVDEQYAPASAMATKGGLTYREVTNLLTFIGKTCNVIGMDIVEFTPKKDLNSRTAKLCLEVATAAFGSKYNWYSEYMNAHTKK